MKRRNPAASGRPEGFPDPGFWQGRKVLLTGHTGFKGAWMLEWLEAMGAHVTGMSLQPEGPVSLFEGLHGTARLEGEITDIRDEAEVARRVAGIEPEIVFHLAAQSLVRRGYADPPTTYAVNIGGTLNVLKAVADVGSARAVVVTTTDKVYRNDGSGRAFVETDPLGGEDPYSRSKAICEMVVSAYHDPLEALGCRVAAARAGNVIGGGDWAADRLIPDAVRAWGRGEKLQVRRPDATRPFQHVLEPLRGYMVLAEKLCGIARCAPAYNFGPFEAGAKVRDVLDLVAGHFDGAAIAYADRIEGLHEAGTLSLDPSLAARDLGVAPVWSLEEGIAHTATWYRSFADGADPRDLCLADRMAYFAALLKAGHSRQADTPDGNAEVA
ncbi:CDP-glucose 4,6-dehydratase [Pseudohoeflea suaedae]|uniref:CDP-glucose 4,6-dehydratase n=1 Tax=Pseudohoeflea suaedae TaxID=877384 RepID=UPI001FCE6B13|nr:CDP-glucose 4,6-dehydratase [Pseudohoeflea suaedae]